MINLISAINWVSVLLAVVSYSILGGLWFTVFFKKPYHYSLGKTIDPQEKPAPIFIVGPAVCSLVITITSAILMQALGIKSLAAAIEFAFLTGIGYLFANTVNIAINPNMPRPLLYGMISGVFHLVGMVIVCTIIATMG